MKYWPQKVCLAALLLTLCCMLCACGQNPSDEKLYAKLFHHFESRGFACRLLPLEEGREVPIYKASVWQSLMVNEEEILLYFDESNRADYLSDSIDRETFGYVTRFGLRFILTYNGTDEAVLRALEEIEVI